MGLTTPQYQAGPDTAASFKKKSTSPKKIMVIARSEVQPATQVNKSGRSPVLVTSHCLAGPSDKAGPRWSQEISPQIRVWTSGVHGWTELQTDTLTARSGREERPELEWVSSATHIGLYMTWYALENWSQFSRRQSPFRSLTINTKETVKNPQVGHSFTLH